MSIYGRVVIGVLTLIGAGFFAVLLIESSVSVPNGEPPGNVDYSQ